METSVSPAAALIAQDPARACELRHTPEGIFMSSTIFLWFRNKDLRDRQRETRASSIVRAFL
jgi:hypothetical protein